MATSQVYPLRKHRSNTPQKNKDIRSKPYEGKMEISPWVESGERLRCRGWKLTWANTKLREKFNKTQLEDTSILAHSGIYNFIQEIAIHTKTGRYLHQSFPRGRKMFEIDTLNNYEFYWLSDHRTQSCFSFLTWRSSFSNPYTRVSMEIGN